MKYKILSIAITLPIVVLVGIFFIAHTHTVSNAYIDSVRQLEEYAKNEQWEQAQSVLTNLSEEWKAKKSLLQLWVVHSDADNVSRYILEAQVGLTLQDQGILFVGTANLLESLEHLQHKDDLSLSNII